MTVSMTEAERNELYKIVHGIVVSERLEIVDKILRGFSSPSTDKLLVNVEKAWLRADEEAWGKLAEFSGLPEGADIPGDK